jgi:hypothetical protein
VAAEREAAEAQEDELMIDADILEGRRRVLAILDELRFAGLLSFSLTPPEIDGPEPHLEVWTDKGMLNQSAWGLGGVSATAARIWDLLRAGTFKIAPSLQAIHNVIERRLG